VFVLIQRLFILLILFSGLAHAVNERPLLVQISGVTGEQLANVQLVLEIYSYNGQRMNSAARLRYLHRAAEAQIKQALQPFGYYKVKVLSDLRETASQWEARYQIELGPPIKVNSVELSVTGPGKHDAAFERVMSSSQLKQGSVLDQQAYEALKKELQFIAAQRGYFDGQLRKNEIRVDLKQYQASVLLHFDTGQRYQLGAVSFQDEQHWLDSSLLQRYVGFEPGDYYLAEELQLLQAALSDSEYYQQVEITASPDTAEEYVIPITVSLTPNKARKYIYGLGYGTDTGIRAKTGITGRRINRKGHHYSAEALVSEIQYGIAGEYIIPGKDPRIDAWGLRANYLDEHSDTRNYQAYSLGSYFKYRDGFWLKTYALDYRIERFKLIDETPVSSLLMPSVEWTRTFPIALQQRVNAKRGGHLRLFLRGGHESLLSDTTFIQPQLSAKWIRSFNNGTRAIVRSSVGSTWVTDFSALPTSLRFFAGGDRSVRGYQYAVIGPGDEEGEVSGGKHLLEASFEYEIPLKNKWSLALFTDVGDAFNDKPDYKTGVGVGLHWLSPIGPVRFDFGHGLRQPVGNRLLLHLSIGPDL
jgi:translocation and assembly module TamA